LVTSEQFWTAPELLKEEEIRTREADVYGFAVILHEVITREEPYSQYDITAKGSWAARWRILILRDFPAWLQRSLDAW
jgi:hypothetical protein